MPGEISNDKLNGEKIALIVNWQTKDSMWDTQYSRGLPDPLLPESSGLVRGMDAVPWGRIARDRNEPRKGA